MFYLLQNIALDIDFNDSEAYQGTSYWPFIGFMCFVIGIVVVFVGVVKIVSAKHQFNLFYDQRDKRDMQSNSAQKDRKIGIIMTVVGVILFIASFFIS